MIGSASAAPYHLVTERGRRYLIPTDADLAALGYRGIQAPVVPAGLLALLPEGPALSRAEALEPHTGDLPVPAPGQSPAAAGPRQA